jgi:ribosomal protein L37AE/L43A
MQNNNNEIENKYYTKIYECTNCHKKTHFKIQFGIKAPPVFWTDKECPNCGNKDWELYDL